MRQGEVAPKGGWIGDPLGGVTAPQPLILPDPATRFSRTAARLEALAATSPMRDWLLFMAQLSRAQHVAAAALSSLAGVEAAAVERSVEARMPPLAADGHRRSSVWRDGLAAMLEELSAVTSREPARNVMKRLRASPPDALETLADTFLRGSVAPDNAGPALYVAAALQVYFTHLAAALPAASLRLLPQRGLCPSCGSTPVAGLITASGQTPGARYLYCSLCSTAWNYVRALCVVCGESRSTATREIEGAGGAVKAETCNECRAYAKMLYQKVDMELDPFADDLASLALDLMVSEAGWARHAPNPLLLIASATTP